MRTEDLVEPVAQAEVLAGRRDFLDLEPFSFSGVGAAKLNVASSVAGNPQTAARPRAYLLRRTRA